MIRQPTKTIHSSPKPVTKHTSIILEWRKRIEILLTFGAQQQEGAQALHQCHKKRERTNDTFLPSVQLHALMKKTMSENQHRLLYCGHYRTGDGIYYRVSLESLNNGLLPSENQY